MLKSIAILIYRCFLLIEKLLLYLAMGMLVAMVAIICYQVALRFLFNYSPSWSEEIAILLMIWFGILSIPIGVKLNLHIGIEYLFNRFPTPIQKIVGYIVHILICIFGVLMVVYGIDLVEFMSMSTLPATKLSSAVEYVVIPISGAMLIFITLEKMISSTEIKEDESDNYDECTINTASDNAT